VGLAKIRFPLKGPNFLSIVQVSNMVKCKYVKEMFSIQFLAYADQGCLGGRKYSNTKISIHDDLLKTSSYG